MKTKTEPSTLTLGEMKRQEGTREPFQSPKLKHFTKSELIHGQKEMAVISHSLGAVSAGRASLSLGKGVGEGEISLQPWLLWVGGRCLWAG